MDCNYNGYPIVLESKILERYSNASWITYVDETKSTSRYVLTLGSGVLSWKSCKQTLIPSTNYGSQAYCYRSCCL